MTAKKIAEYRTQRKLYKTFSVDDKSNFPISRTICLPQVNSRYNYSVVETYSFGENDITRELLRKADVLTYVVNAMSPLEKWDMETLRDYFSGKQLDNIFFAVNKVNLLSTEDDLQSLQKYLEENLKPIFTDKKGNFDKMLFDERVFYIDALGSLNTRMGRKTPITRNHALLIPDEDTGLPDMEKALYKFLA